MKKNVYLYQIGVSLSSPVFLPYSMGCIASYALADKEITGKYNIKDIIFRRTPVEEAVNAAFQPFLAAFSVYIWNTEYSLEAARRIKEKNPECITVFGGHNIPQDSSFLEKYSFIDYLMFGEGEESFSLLLKALEKNGNLSGVAGLAYRDGKRTVLNEVREPGNLDSFPSPYTTGLFDSMLQKYSETEFHATLETNRGCPYGCGYCDWCGSKRIREFPMEKIKAEIRWIAEHKIPYCYCADANFGILPRDLEIAEYIIEQRGIYGFPGIFKPCYAKDGGETVFEAGRLLNLSGADKGVTLAYQTTSPEAMKNIGRSNRSLEIFASLESRFNKAGIPTYTEFILGIPGETYDSFRNGICGLLEAGQNNSMTVYECQLLPNSPLYKKESIEKFGIRVSKIPLLGIHYNPEFSGINEYFYIITGTASLPPDEWLKADMFAVILQTFHHLGLLRCFAVYSRYENNIAYAEFYDRLLNYIYSEKGTFLNSLFVSLTERKRDTEKADWTYQDDRFGTTGWYFEEGAFLELLFNEKDFWHDIEPFLRTLNISSEVFGELFEYQKNIIRRPFTDGARFTSSFDFYTYFNRIDERAYSPLEKKNIRITVIAENIGSWQDYAKKIIWFGKRRSATLCTNKTEKLTLEYL